MELTKREKDFLNRLGVGRENGEHAYQLGNSRTVRYLVASLRKKEYPICSGDEGYWLAKNSEEIRESVSLINSRIARLTAVAEGLKKAKSYETIRDSVIKEHMEIWEVTDRFCT